MPENVLIGIDLGGTKLEGVVYNAVSKKTLVRKRIPTESGLGYNHILDRISLLSETLQRETDINADCIGFGTPGKWDQHHGCIQNSNTTCLNGKPLKNDLQKRLKANISIANDANCFALAETLLGDTAKHNPEVVFGIIMGTGVGGGIVVNNSIINGLHGIAGEWGHNFLDASGGKCYCGKIGCVETIISGTALETFYQSTTGKRRQLKEIVERSEENDQYAVNTLHRLHFFFGKAVANVINLIDPDVMVVGGGVGNIESLYKKGVEAILPFIFNDQIKTRILKPSLGDSAGVYGAALLCQHQCS